MPAWIPNDGRGPLDGPWPVDLGPPNRFGLHGIAANIHEWCADWHSREYYAQSPTSNPRGPASGVRRASRGGSWRHAVTISRSSARSKLGAFVPLHRLRVQGRQVSLETARLIAERVRTAGGRALIVGGWVRDQLLGRPNKDVDIEVFGLPAERVKALLDEIRPCEHRRREFYGLQGRRSRCVPAAHRIEDRPRAQSVRGYGRPEPHNYRSGAAS